MSHVLRAIWILATIIGCFLVAPDKGIVIAYTLVIGMATISALTTLKVVKVISKVVKRVL